MVAALISVLCSNLLSPCIKNLPEIIKKKFFPILELLLNFSCLRFLLLQNRTFQQQEFLVGLGISVFGVLDSWVINYEEAALLNHIFNQAHWVSAPSCIKKLLPFDEPIVIPLSQEGELKLNLRFKKIFLFLYFSFCNAHRYPRISKAYAHKPLTFTQFKKVLSSFGF